MKWKVSDLVSVFRRVCVCVGHTSALTALVAMILYLAFFGVYTYLVEQS